MTRFAHALEKARVQSSARAGSSVRSGAAARAGLAGSVALLALSSVSAVHAESDPDARAQAFARTIELSTSAAHVSDTADATETIDTTDTADGPNAPETWAEVTLDDEIRIRSAEDLRDILIVDGSGKVLPQRFRAVSAMDTHWDELLRIDVDWREDPGRGWFADLESPDVPPRSLLVFSDPGIRLEEWRQEDGRGSNLFAERRHVPDLESRFAGSGFSAFVVDEGVPRYRAYVSSLARRPDGEAVLYAERREQTELEEVGFRQRDAGSMTNRSSLIVELDGPARAISQLRVRVDGELRGGLQLETEVADPDGSREWVRPPDQDLRIVARDGAAGEWTIDCPSPRHAQRLRLHGSSWPSSDYVRVVSILAVPDRIEFLPGGRPPYRLLYGDEQAQARRATVLPPAVLIEARTATRLGPEEANPFHESPRGFEWLRRHPAVLSGALFAVLALLAVLALTGRRPRGQTSGG
ncbi:MAG: hypothetical protein R3E97_17015 [Candidatus Eisenbacteria bacterium]